MATVLRDLVARLRWDAPMGPLEQFDRRIDKSVRGMSVLDGALKKAGAAAAAYFGAQQVLQFGNEAIDKSIEFGGAVAKIQQVLPGASGRVAELEQQILGLSTTTGKSSTDIANTVNEIVQAYGDSADTMGIARTATLGAATAQTTSLETLKLLTAVTLAYGDTSAETNKKVMDMAFTAKNLGQTTIPEMSAAIGVATPLASALGVSMEELFAGIGTLSGVTGSTAEVTTQLRSAMVAMLNPTKDMEAALKKSGITSIRASIAQRGFVGTLKTLVGTTDGSQEAVQKLFGRVEGLNATLQLTGPQMQRFEQQLLAQKNAAGAADEAYREGAGGANAMGTEMEKAEARISKAQIGIGKALGGMKLDWLNLSASVVATIDEEILPAIDRMVNKDKSLRADDGFWTKTGKMLLGGGEAVLQVAGGLTEQVTNTAGTVGDVLMGDGGDAIGARNVRAAEMAAYRIDQLAQIGRAFSGGRGFTGEQRATAEEVAAADRATRVGGGPAPVDKGTQQGKLIRNAQNTVIMNGNVVVTLPPGSDTDPAVIADAIARGTFREIARNLPNASEVAQ